MNRVFIKKKFILVVFLVFVLAFSAIVSGCAKTGNNQENLIVYTSVYPLYDFAKKIAGEYADVRSLIPAGAEPHDWEPSVSDMISLEKADILIINGLGMEHWVEKVSATLDNKELLIVESAYNISQIETELGHEHEHEMYDPHVWLNPQNAKEQMKSIKNTLISADEKNRTFYEANYLKYEKMFDELDDEYKHELSKTARNKIIVSHRAFAYLCEAYNLTELSIGGVFDDAEPDPATMAETIKNIQAEGVEYIFYTNSNNTKVVDTIAKEAGVKTLYLSPLEYISSEDEKSNSDYFSIMIRNLENLKKSLK